MGQIVTVTVGSDTFSVYALTSDAVADLTSYWNLRLGAVAAAVAAASSDNKKKSLAMAASWIDRAVQFSGDPTVSSQPRAWPRNSATCNDKTIADNSTPDNVAKAEFELAGQLLVDSSIDASVTQGSNVRAVKAGPAGVDFFLPTVIDPQYSTRLPIQANDLLKCMYSSAGTVPAPEMTGTDVEDFFDEDDFERERPLR